MSASGLRDDRVRLRHGAGGRAMRDLVRELFVPGEGERVDGIGLDALDDGAAIRVGDRWLVVTTDAHVIQPVFFPGGDIGRLAVCGSVNDLAVMGATEIAALTCAVVLEEGYPQADLARITRSLHAACKEARAPLVSGDTKVMRRGEVDGIVLCTTAVGFAARPVSDAGLRPGDRLVVSGMLGDHGFAVLAAREDLELGDALASDVAPLRELVATALGAVGEDLVAMKDPTRGGLAGALHEMAEKSGVGVVLDERALPLREEVRAASELLGIDPLHVANEGKAVMGVAPARAEALVEALRGHPLGRDAAIVGTCVDAHRGSVVVDTGIGRRLLDELEGEPLPRIC
ncbi:MAG: hydrogenase expression/formation protein HypE [Myxococcota bacterium]|nr:hydrogenase expression/formation protein HypE [Myxococcota bacterium]